MLTPLWVLYPAVDHGTELSRFYRVMTRIASGTEAMRQAVGALVESVGTAFNDDTGQRPLDARVGACCRD